MYYFKKNAPETAGSCSYFANIAQTEENGAFVGDYFQTEYVGLESVNGLGLSLVWLTDEP